MPEASHAATPDHPPLRLGPLGPAASAAVAVSLYIVAAIVLTWPQAANLHAVPDLGDPPFSAWRMAWIAHQLPLDPGHLFDANIFFPERHTLAYSDAALLPNLLAAPMLWSGVTPIVAYNVLLIASFALSGITMFMLAWSLTHRVAAAFLAGLIFAALPYRFAHYAHFEPQFICWIPLAVLALHRTMNTGRVRDGLLTGLAVAAQALSYLYGAVFLIVYLAVAWTVMAAASWRSAARSLAPLAAGAAVAAALVWPIVPPYLAARAAHGERSRETVEQYSAVPRDYLVAPSNSALFAEALGRRRVSERELFQGFLIVVLAAAGLAGRLTMMRAAAVAGLLWAFDGSLGFNGLTYGWLYDHVMPFRGLRVPARLGALVGFSLSLLAAYGVVRLMDWLPGGRARAALIIVLAAGVLAEARVTLDLGPVSRRIPPAYRYFDGQPTAAIVELPLPPAPAETARESRFLLYSTRHWQRLANGNSGTIPRSYEQLLEAMRTFPDDASVALLRARGIRFVVAHQEFHGRDDWMRLIDAISGQANLREVHRAGAAGYEARIYRVH